MKLFFWLVFLTSMIFSINGFLRIGHRGACGYEPENTLISFERAINQSVDMIELDVYQCASGELVVMHDDTLDRTTNGNGNVWEQTLTELKKLDAGNGQKIPTLSEVFNLVDKRVKINVELKGENTALLTAQLIKYYVNNKGWSYNDFYVSSFNHAELAFFKHACPEVKVGGLYEGTDAPLAAFKKDCSSYAAIGVSKNSLTQEYVDEAHRRNLEIYVYTVNDAQEIKMMKEMGVDGIFCNYPDRLK